jgi:hypothetical protein
MLRSKALLVILRSEALLVILRSKALLVILRSKATKDLLVRDQQVLRFAQDDRGG